MRLTEKDIEFIQQKITPLFGEKIYEAQLQIGSMISLDFGKPCPGSEWRGEWGLRIEQSIWNLNMGEKGIIAADDTRDAIVLCLGYMVGAALVGIKIRPPSLDTTLWFSNGFGMRLFPIFSQFKEHRHDWLLYTPDNQVLTIGCGAFWSYKPLDS